MSTSGHTNSKGSVSPAAARSVSQKRLLCQCESSSNSAVVSITPNSGSRLPESDNTVQPKSVSTIAFTVFCRAIASA